jgi:carbamoyltransferase
MNILGLSSFKRNPAAVLFCDGKVAAGIEDQKLLRSRTRGMPITAIESCLEHTSLDWKDLDSIAVASRPLQGWRRRSWARAKQSAFSPLANAYYEADDSGLAAQQLNHIRRLRKRVGDDKKVVTLDHHLCHAASAFYCSPYDKALVLTLDEEGDGRSGTLSVGEGNKIRVIETIAFPHSIGWIYTLVTDLVGFHPHEEEHKTQWLSLEGEPEHKSLFLKLMRSSESALPSLDFSYFTRGLAGGLPFSAKFYKQIGVTDPAAITQDQKKTLAASVQAAATEIIADLVTSFARQNSLKDVCLGGGIFQNALLIADLEKRLEGLSFFVPPAPGNTGTALGAALTVWHEAGHPRTNIANDVYWGPSFSSQDIKDVLDNCKARYSVSVTDERKMETTVHLLMSGKIVGWYQGAAEFGPRALGNRSVLASPWGGYVKENLNDYIKHREWFRPFALAVPEEDCGLYFEASSLCEHMNSLAWERPDHKILPEGLAFDGGRVRLQIVKQETNPLFWRLLKQFGESAPAPILVNTSFNLFGEPLVVNPRDAVRSYFCSGLDAMVIGNFVLAKAGLSQLQSSAKTTISRAPAVV